ncbi:MAG: DNA-processing protein DprA [Pseudothermotoga sp.]
MIMNSEITCIISLMRAELTKKEINTIIDYALETGMSVSDILNLSSIELQKAFSISIKDVSKVLKAKDYLGNTSFLVERLKSNGIKIISTMDHEYPKKFEQNLGINERPPVIYCKGSVEFLNRRCIAIVGSRDANEKSIEFTKNIAKRYVERGFAIVSGFARGVDRTAFEAAIDNKGEAIIVLAQGILSFRLPKEYYEHYANKKILILSTYLPDSQWHVGNAMERNKYIYALGDKVYIAESRDNQGGTWHGAMDAKDKGNVNVYVRYPEKDEKNGNEKLIRMGLKAVDIYGEEIDTKRDIEELTGDVECKKEKAEEIIKKDIESKSISKDDASETRSNSIEERIMDILKDGGLRVSQIREKLQKNGIELSSRKITSILRSMENIDSKKTSKGCVYFIKGKGSENLSLWKGSCIPVDQIMRIKHDNH